MAIEISHTVQHIYQGGHSQNCWRCAVAMVLGRPAMISTSSYATTNGGLNPTDQNIRELARVEHLQWDKPPGQTITIPLLSGWLRRGPVALFGGYHADPNAIRDDSHVVVVSGISSTEPAPTPAGTTITIHDPFVQAPGIGTATVARFVQIFPRCAMYVVFR